MLPTPIVVRLADRLRAAWQARAGPGPESTAAWDRLDAQLATVAWARRRVRLAARHGLTLVLPDLTADLAADLDELARRVDDLRAVSAPPRFAVPDPGAWVADLRQLEDEFGELTVDWRAGTLAVATAPVVLAGVALGAFAVAFDWVRVGRSSSASCFAVTALHPNPAAGRPDVSHPHVQGHALCAGDAEDPLDIAVGEGRLADAFLLVRSVLTTYNPRSAYAPLDAWDGSTCSECDRVVVQDDRLSCEGCDADLCDQCAGSCSVCSATRCGECLDRCPVCEDRCCPGCLTPTTSDRAVCPACRATCSACRAPVPADQVDEETGRCPNCLTTDDDESDDVPPPPTEEPARCDATTPTPGG